MKTLKNYLDFCSKHQSFTGMVIFLFLATVMITSLCHNLGNRVKDFIDTSRVNYTEVKIKASSKTNDYLQEVVTLVKAETARQGDKLISEAVEKAADNVGYGRSTTIVH